jgi:hypothetical protein
MIGTRIFESIVSKDTSNGGGEKDGSLGDKVKGWIEDGKAQAESRIGDVIREGAEKLTKELQISDWYSLHVMGSCKGSFEPNATAIGARINVTNCTDATLSGMSVETQFLTHEFGKAEVDLARLNVTKALDHDVRIGSLKINPASFGAVRTIQDKVDKLNNVLLVLFIGHIAATIIIGIGLLCSTKSSTTGQPGVSVRLNLLLAIFGSVLWIIGTSIITAVFNSVVGEINKIGNEFGFSAQMGKKFYALIWITAGCMVCVSIIWFREWWQGPEVQVGQKGGTRST